MKDNKTCFGKFNEDNCECIICNVVVECYESKLVQMLEHQNKASEDDDAYVLS